MIDDGGPHHEGGAGDVVLSGLDGEAGGRETGSDSPLEGGGHDSELPPPVDASHDTGHDASHDAGPCSSTPTYELIVDEKMSSWATPETCCGITYTCSCLTALPAPIVCQGMGTNVGGCAETFPIQVDCN
jgi:hypothetical protein